MKSRKSHLLSLFALIFFFMLLPAWSYSQESRLLDIPEVENDNATLSMSNAVREIFSEQQHIVFNDADMIQNATAAGVEDPFYWYTGDLVKKVNAKNRHDAVLISAIVKDGKKTILSIDVRNAYTGESVGVVKQSIANKKKLSTKEKRAILAAVTDYLNLINPADYPALITIVINSTPSGASVLRGGRIIGQTPLTMETEEKKYPESWTLAYEGYNEYVQKIDLTQDGEYNISMEVATTAEDSSNNGGALGKMQTGRALPIFRIGFSVDPTIRSLDTDVQTGNAFDYSTAPYAMFAFDLEFFPLTLALDNPWVGGIGLFGNVGFGFLNHVLSSTSITEGNAPECEAVDANGKKAFRCGTTHTRFQVGLLYRILLQSDEAGHRDVDGMNLDILLGYTWNQFELKQNPSYNGHGYQGMFGGVRFGTYLGLRDLRLDVEFDFQGYFGYGTGSMISAWGESVDSGFGINLKLDLMYVIWKGLYAKVGYSLTYAKTTYNGAGNQKIELGADGSYHGVEPTGSIANDMYHEIMIGVGYSIF